MAWTVVFTFTALFQCGTHIGAFFGSPRGFREFCRPSIPNGWAYVISDAVTDLVTLGIPIPLVGLRHYSTFGQVTDHKAE